MKIGICTGIENIKYAKECGYDFIEGMFCTLAAMSDQEFRDYVRECEKVDLPAYSFNCYFSGETNIFANDALSVIKPSIEKGFERAAAVGGRNAVIGSGRVRRIPDRADSELFKRRFADILSLSGDIAAKYNMTLSVEPLNSNETNFINTVSEGAELARLSGRDNVGVLVDFYHFTCEKESDDALVPVADILYHAHISTPRPGRGIPEEEDIPIVRKWVRMLSDIGYNGSISLECSHNGDIAESYRRAKKILDIFKEN